MFKKLILATLCSAAAMSGAQAADSVDLKVTGTLTSGSCTPSLGNGGVVDFGHIPLGNLSKTETNQLGKKMTSLTITCTSEMIVGWQAVDNKHDTLKNLTVNKGFANGGNCTGSSSQFGLGKTHDDVNIGAYCLAVDVNNITVDGVKSQFIEKSYLEDNSVWHTLAGGDLLNGSDGKWRTASAAAESSMEPVAGKVFVYPLNVTAAIQGSDALAITDETNLDGLATLSLVYI